ncbi:glycosyltransferase [Pinibacter aurantiacus]|uniref:Glycosyltransferase n=1 Tax=Pinibacter aurantiacus TaxID=2851599 RepID=A0A9E2SAX1_9BACT|nr:glycosyltransferase [Pinibacter aurantiacus]MBV4357839.1 glycosyltransferase [Pinibacter aurantiacus]
MKIAFVDNLHVAGGLSRFSLLLCKNLVANNDVTIDYFVHSGNLPSIPEIHSISEKVTVKVIKASMPRTSLLNKVTDKIFKGNGNDSILKEIEKEVDEKYDIAYFPSAHMMKRPNLRIPIVGTLHDFNWKYFFGKQIFSLSFVKMMDVEILKWMETPYNVCSAQDVVDEAQKLYPNAKHFPTVVHIGPVVVNQEIDDAKSKETLKKVGIDFPYIIFPGNFFPHKNHLNLFTAFYLLRQRPGFENYKLILTGKNSESIPKGIAEYRGVQLLTSNSPQTFYDVRGMGYQPNEVLDALIKNAKLLVSPSIYEAICTPAMDAWNFGTPTAISDIPPFREHEKAWGIRSAFFDPMNPEKIADVLEAYLKDYDRAIEDGKTSKENMSKYSWKHVSKGYMEVFEKAIAKK